MKNPVISFSAIFVLSLAIISPARADVVQGTMIRMANNTQQRVESLGSREVIRGGNNLKVRVLQVIKGKPGTSQVVLIYTANHHQLKLSPNQLVVTANGVIAADKLQKWHKLVTEEGVVPIAELSRKSYQGSLYSLRIEGEGGQQYFANDILLFQNPSKPSKKPSALKNPHY